MTEFMDDPILLTKKLIGFRSITPDDGGSLEFIASLVERVGFKQKSSLLKALIIFLRDGLQNQISRKL